MKIDFKVLVQMTHMFIHHSDLKSFIDNILNIETNDFH